MFCSPYSQISAGLTVIDSITFVTIDAIDTTFGKFICFIFVIGKDFAYVVGINVSCSDIVFFKNIIQCIEYKILYRPVYTTTQ